MDTTSGLTGLEDDPIGTVDDVSSLDNLGGTGNSDFDVRFD